MHTVHAKKLAVFLICTFIPRNLWYAASYKIARIFAYFGASRKKPYVNTQAIGCAFHLNNLLALLTRKGLPFPIPIEERVNFLGKQHPHGLMLVCTHLPLVKVALRYLVETGNAPDFALAKAGNMRYNNEMAVWGINERIPVVTTDSFVLQKARTLLRQGKTLVVMVDKTLGAAYSPNVFKLAETVNADIAFVQSSLSKNGVIHVGFVESQWNGTIVDSKTEMQMQELYDITAEILHNYDQSGYLNPPCKNIALKARAISSEAVCCP